MNFNNAVELGAFLNLAHTEELGADRDLFGDVVVVQPAARLVINVVAADPRTGATRPGSGQQQQR